MGVLSMILTSECKVVQMALIHDVWIEYEQQQSFEAHLVKDLDKLDMIIQAEEYEKMEENKGIDLSDFFKGTRGVFKTEIGKQLDAELMKRRKARKQANTQ